MEKNARRPEEQTSASTGDDSTPNDHRDEDRPLYLPLTWSKPEKRERMPRGKHRRNARRAIAARKRGGA
ncbi:hypothetical protein ACKVEX_05535 [Rhodocyclaceae bacterium SMB388]